MAPSNRDRVRQALDLLGPALDRFITSAVAERAEASDDWTLMLAAVDASKGGDASRRYNREDPQNGLRMITENITHRSIPGWYPFRKLLSRPEESLASELREIRNLSAHNERFSTDDAYRALDTAERFLIAIGATDEAAEVKRSRIDLRRLSSAEEDRKVVRAAGATEVGGAGLRPWREVLRPHDDVASGNFHAAEFAADLAMVARGEGDPEYTDPVAFFQRTFLTEGLRDLIVRAASRLSGDMNAAPVINLQTNFGGGKTHSMLALWHLASGRDLADFPQEVQDLLAGHDLPAQVRRVALVGTQMQAGQPNVMADGTRINTIWGMLARS